VWVTHDEFVMRLVPAADNIGTHQYPKEGCAPCSAGALAASGFKGCFASLVYVLGGNINTWKRCRRMTGIRNHVSERFPF